MTADVRVKLQQVGKLITREIIIDNKVYSYRRIKLPVLTNPLGVVQDGVTSIAAKERAFLDTLCIQRLPFR
jgi:hypothetical protein